MTVDTTPVFSERIIALVRNDFPDSELRTALWLLRECVGSDVGRREQARRKQVRAPVPPHPRNTCSGQNPEGSDREQALLLIDDVPDPGA